MGFFKKLFRGKHKHDFVWDGEKLNCKGCEEVRTAENYMGKAVLLVMDQRITGADKSAEISALLAEFPDKTKIADSCIMRIKKKGDYVKQDGMIRFIGDIMGGSVDYYRILEFMKEKLYKKNEREYDNIRNYIDKKLHEL